MLAKFESVIARHPDTSFVAVHAFNLANDLARVDALLAKYPNVQIDFAARMWELARQPFSARHFFLKNADRILFGSDNDPADAMYLAHVRQMETEDEWFWPADAEWWRGYGRTCRTTCCARSIATTRCGCWRVRRPLAVARFMNDREWSRNDQRSRKRGLCGEGTSRNDRTATISVVASAGSAGRGLPGSP